MLFGTGAAFKVQTVANPKSFSEWGPSVRVGPAKIPSTSSERDAFDYEYVGIIISIFLADPISRSSRSSLTI